MCYPPCLSTMHTQAGFFIASLWHRRHPSLSAGSRQHKQQAGGDKGVEKVVTYYAILDATTETDDMCSNGVAKWLQQMVENCVGGVGSAGGRVDWQDSGRVFSMDVCS